MSWTRPEGWKRIFRLDRFGVGLNEGVDEEVRFHFETRLEEGLRAGLPPEEARAEAIRVFGDPDLVAHRCRRAATRSLRRNAIRESLSDLAQDLRFSLRSLLRARGFTSVAVLSLACGVGAFTGFFTLNHTTFFTPVPGVTEPERVAELMVVEPGREMEEWTYPDYQDLREASSPFSEVAGWVNAGGTMDLGRGGEPIEITYVSANYFRVLGVIPERGRAFLESEDAGQGQRLVAVVSHGMWQDRLGGDPQVVGRVVTLNRAPYTVVGVAPEAFKGHRPLQPPRDFWLPLSQSPYADGTDGLTEDRGSHWLRVLARLEDGATIGEAKAALNTIFGRLEEEHPETNQGRGAKAYTFGPIPAHTRTENLLAVALGFGLLTLVLLIISGNVAGMMLARSVARERELAIRLSLGSGRGRLARLLLVEAFVLAAAGGGIGLFLGVWVLDAVYASLPGFPEVSLGFSWPVVSFAVLATLGTVAAVGLPPALRFSRPDLVSSLKDDSGAGGRRVGRIHRISASAQAGLALILLVSASLFLRAIGVMADRDLGFEPQGLYTIRLDLSSEGMESLDVAESFFQRARGALGALPGVTSVSVADGIPMDLVGNFSSAARGDLPETDGISVRVEFTRGDEAFFQTIGAKLIRGRGFQRTDDANSDPVMVINESLATQLWPGEDPVGRRIRSAVSRGGPQEFTVIGVVGDVASSRPTRSWPQVFASYRQDFYPRVMIALRGAVDAEGLVRSIQSTLLSLDPNLAYPVVMTSESLVDQSMASQRLTAKMAGGLGVLALLLAAIGVYGVVAFAVSGRTREIGLRMAMGATQREILAEVMRDAVKLAVPGLVLGSLISAAAAAAFRSELLGLSPVDPVSFLMPAGILFVIVILASLAPARRASDLDPMRALRME